MSDPTPFDFSQSNPVPAPAPSKKNTILLLIIGGAAVPLLGSLVCGGAVVGGWWVLYRQPAKDQPRAAWANPFEAKEPDQAGKTIDDVIDHFGKGGITGKLSKKREDDGICPGCAWGITCEGQDFHFHLLEYRTWEFAENARAGGKKVRELVNPEGRIKGHRNGRFLLEITAGESKVLPVFKAFK